MEQFAKLKSIYAKKRVLITGGAGFIGSKLAKSLVELGAFVTILDNFSSGSMENLRSIAHKVSIVPVSLDDVRFDLEKINPKYIFHFAAVSSVPLAEKDPKCCNTVNVEMTKKLALNSLNLKVKPKIIFASSSSVYGQASQACDEQCAKKPASIYAHSKADAEDILQEISNQHELKVCSARFFNVFDDDGIGGQKSSANFNFLSKIKNDQAVPIFGSGENVRDYVSVSKVVFSCLVLGASDVQEAFAVFNVGTGKPTTVLDFAKQVASKIGKQIVGFDFLPSRQGDVMFSLADTKKLDQLMNSFFGEHNNV